MGVREYVTLGKRFCISTGDERLWVPSKLIKIQPELEKFPVILQTQRRKKHRKTAMQVTHKADHNHPTIPSTDHRIAQQTV